MSKIAVRDAVLCTASRSGGTCGNNTFMLSGPCERPSGIHLKRLGRLKPTRARNVVVAVDFRRVQGRFDCGAESIENISQQPDHPRHPSGASVPSAESLKPTVPIAFCITELDPGGAERALVRLATGLNRERWQPTVYCLSGYGPLADDLVAAGIPTHCLGAKSWRSAGMITELARRLRSERPALLQTFLFHANIAGRIAGWRAGIKPIVSGHRVAEKERRWHVWLDRLTANLADCHVCVSQGVAEFAEREVGLPPRRLVVIPNGVEVARFADALPADLSPWGISPGTPVFLTIGRLEPQKAMPVLLDAFAIVRESHPTARLLIVGDGSQRTHLEQRIQSDPRLASAVHLLGRRDDIPQLLQSATCLVSSSLWEGLPNVILEAFAAGRPVVATQIEGSRELVRRGETGWLAAPGSAPELAQAMRHVLDAPEAAREYGQRAQHQVREHYSWERMVARYEELYERLLADCHGMRSPAGRG